ncbi:hypothetical protein COU77_04055 [Candidatus Peregrinibacteria bacterium CG10_big_fil_rev_8_21_14_0_10_49_16]|nr:MAG: hypothetical protein COW95_04475 [Candidatus Peregrinibacteria bacterium CG22_combo_CG10-13_8_21_14_all_49_11]PIR51737.1 MAG: hypothetical protein COU77_04055 [Candidatus Peregrinibacteria bacterium CG10_big_fil_rev_8_21_14_0_10_49_16]
MLYMSGCVFLLVSAFLLLEHVIVVRQVASLQLPVFAEIPALQRQLHSLEEQIRVAETQSLLLGSAEEEIVRMYILPSQKEYQRFIRFVGVLEEWLREEGSLYAFSPVYIGDTYAVQAHLSSGEQVRLSVQPVSLTVEVSSDAASDLIRFVQLAGNLSVGDILREEDLLDLLQATEEENPAGIIALEQFLGADLFQYSNNPRLFEEQVRRSFVSASLLDTFQDLVDGPLRPVRSLLGSKAGRMLQSADLWPPQLFLLNTVAVRHLSADRARVHLELETYSRS